MDTKRDTYHPDACAECVWGQVRPELAFYDTGVAVRASDTPMRIEVLQSTSKTITRSNWTHPQMTRTFDPWISRFAR